MKKLRKRDKYLLTAIINVTWYTIVVLVLSGMDKTVPAELTAGWYSLWAVELALLAGIKIKGVRNETEIDE